MSLNSNDHQKYTNFLGFGTMVRFALKKWYFAIAIPAMSTAYYVYKSLEEQGILDKILNEITANLEVIEFIGKTCTKHILDFSALYQCINQI